MIPQLAIYKCMVYKWYILPIGGLYATCHLLGEPVQQPLISAKVSSFLLELSCYDLKTPESRCRSIATFFVWKKMVCVVSLLDDDSPTFKKKKKVTKNS